MARKNTPASEPSTPSTGAVDGAAPAPEAPAPEEIKATALLVTVTVTAKREGFRRAGRAWSKQPTSVPLADLSADQVAMLRAEPMLDVVVDGE